MAKVTISRVSVENFGPFKDRQSLSMSTVPHHPITLIKALNGSGKTTLLTALQFGLYGQKALHGSKRSDYEATITSFQRADANGPSRVEIELSIETSGVAQRVRIVREWVVKGASVTEKLFVGHDADELTNHADDWDDYITRILPAELAQLFLFDGEKIEALANPERLPLLLRRATEVFLGIDGIDALVSDLRALERRTLTRGKNTSFAFEGVKAQEEMLLAQVQEAETEGAKWMQLCAAARNELDAATLELNRYTDKANREGATAYEQAGLLQGDLLAAKDVHRESRKALLDLISDPLIALANCPNLWVAYAELHESEYGAYRARLMLDEMKRRDGRVIRALPQSVSTGVREKLRIALSDDLRRYAIPRRVKHLNMECETPSDAVDHVNGQIKRLGTALSRFTKATSKLQSAESAVSMVPSDEQLRLVLSELRRLTLAVATANAKVEAASGAHAQSWRQLEHAQSRLNTVTTRLREEFRGKALEVKSVDAGVRARTVLERLKDRLLAEKATWLSRVITEQFKQLLHKQNLVSSVRVDPSTYAVTILDPSGGSLPMDRLSAGERHMLAIAVLSALIKERKGGFPVVVDSPLARLDRGHRETIIQKFFASVSHQVLVLATDEEVDGSIHKLMLASTNTQHLLEFVDATRSSSLSQSTAAVSLGVAA